MSEDTLTNILVQNLKKGGINKLVKIRNSEKMDMNREIGNSSYVADIFISLYRDNDIKKFNSYIRDAVGFEPPMVNFNAANSKFEFAFKTPEGTSVQGEIKKDANNAGKLKGVVGKYFAEYMNKKINQYGYEYEIDGDVVRIKVKMGPVLKFIFKIFVVYRLHS